MNDYPGYSSGSGSGRQLNVCTGLCETSGKTIPDLGRPSCGLMVLHRLLLGLVEQKLLLLVLVVLLLPVWFTEYMLHRCIPTFSKIKRIDLCKSSWIQSLRLRTHLGSFSLVALHTHTFIHIKHASKHTDTINTLQTLTYARGWLFCT